MTSAIDPTVIVDGAQVAKSDMRTQLGIARDEISALQALVPTTTATLQAVGDDTTKIASTEWVQNEIVAQGLSGGLGGTYNTRALAIAATIPITIDTVRLLGYTTVNDGGGAVYKRVVAEPTHSGKFSSNGATVWWEIAEKFINTKMIGCMADYSAGNTNDATAFTNFFNTIRALKSTGVQGVIQGLHYIATNLFLDFKAVGGYNGGTIMAANSAIDGLYCNTGVSIELGSTSGAVYYERIGFRISGNNNTNLLKIADDAFALAWNKCHFEFQVNNASTTKAAECVRLNYVLDSTGYILSNGGGSGNPFYNIGTPGDEGYGIGINSRQMVMNSMELSAGNCNIALLVSGGSSNGNSFRVRLEEASRGLQITSSSVVSNTFDGKIVALYPIDAQQGLQNGGFLTIDIYPTGSYLRASGEKFWVRGATFSWTNVLIPATTVPYRNISGRRIRFRFRGDCTVMTITQSNGAAFGVPGLSADCTVDEVLCPDDTVVITYTGTPAWQARPDQ